MGLLKGGVDGFRASAIFINSGTAKVKIVKTERDPPLFTGKLLIKF
jgi:hypothetical protein